MISQLESLTRQLLSNEARRKRWKRLERFTHLLIEEKQARNQSARGAEGLFLEFNK